ncbi:MAG: hypothetical protein NTZ83_05760 [Candidatus Pacearchaeota archaeon]|nr:hypothetical protein [Candidatus Pacearchaeota archaeon]
MKKEKFIEKEKKVIKKEWWNILFNCIFAILALLFPILFYKNIPLTTILLLIVSIIGLLKWKSWITLVIFIFGGLFGPLCEIIATKYGVWQYTLPNFLTVPIWLFLVWAMAAAFLYQTALEFIKLGVKK